MSTDAQLGRIAILGFGAMGAGVAETLLSRGRSVSTFVADRSTATKARATDLNIIQTGDFEELVQSADIFLSVVPADQAVPLAQTVAANCGGRERPLHFVDCNSITPAKTEAIAEIVTAAGCRFTDAGIIGSPPKPGGANRTLFYTSGPHRHELSGLETENMTVRPLGEGLTQATQMKVLFAAINKGTVALLMNVLAAARVANLEDELVARFDEMRPGLIETVRRQSGALADKAARWSIEMEDLAAALDGMGVDGGYHQVAAESYQRLARNIDSDVTRGRQRPETVDEILEAWRRLPNA